MGQNNNDKSDKSLQKSVAEALISGAISSTITTILYQPLELLKTRIQLGDRWTTQQHNQVFGHLRNSATSVAKSDGLKGLWRGTGASLMRSGPGVGLYYALLNIFQTNFSGQNHKPDTASQAFYFGLTARSLVSFVLLPITVVKVRYESGRFEYKSLNKAIQSAYANPSGWVGIVPTILRDSLFSGTYYMCYIRLKDETNNRYQSTKERGKQAMHLRNFFCGLASGLVASVITNPIDVVKTKVQVAQKSSQSRQSTIRVIREVCAENPRRFLDGLFPRSLRRTLIAASTWTFYEFIMDIQGQRKSI